ncbi:MAG: hypothetical protein HON90_08680 [Halobacteriovoraceae bacterium]|jgi:hypothetical protein|nr:hypothetical protein [Halobacteriovoraceae bacterium]
MDISLLKKLSVFIAVLLFFACIALYLVVPEYSSFSFSLFGVASFIVFVHLYFNRIDIWTFIRSSLFKVICSHLLNLFLLVCVLAMINFLAVKNDYFTDFTTNKLHTLSDQSLNTLKLLEKNKMKFKLFATRVTWKKYLKLLSLYKSSSRNVELEAFDVSQEVTLTQLYNITENGTLVIEYLGNTYQSVIKDELSVTNLLFKILNPKKKTLYYSVGHNEMGLTDKNLMGGDFLRDKVLSSNYNLKPLELQKGIPADAAALLVLNPQIEFLESEIEQMEKYLTKGGTLLTTLSPQFNGILFTKYLTFLKKFGVSYHNALILDRLAEQQGSQASIPVVNSYDKQHIITKNLVDRTLFPVSGVISLSKSKMYQWKTLLKSTPFPGSWGETSFDEIRTGKAQYNEDEDFKGPMSIVVAGEYRKSRILVFASASFISNQFQGQSNNFNLFLNSLSWLVREEALMSLTRPNLEGNLIYISDIQLSLIFYFTVLFFPFLFFGYAIYMYRKRGSM